ncbi:MAG TPA: extracellular solute-binding protein [Clostridiales bacterium]|nr:extracellular solute-binding protein [Clostridiales bacterium]
MLRKAAFDKRKISYPLKWLCCLLVLAAVLQTMASAAPGIPLKDKFKSQVVQPADDISGISVKPNYAQIKEEYSKLNRLPAKGSEVILTAEDLSARSHVPEIKSGIGGNEDPALVWDNQEDWFEWSFSIADEGLYEIHVEYYPLPGTGLVIQRGLLIDDDSAFQEAYNMLFFRSWVDDGEPRKNSKGDDVRPRQAEVPYWRTLAFHDSKGLYPEPLQFYLEKGQHTLRLIYIDQPMAITRIILKPPEELPAYVEVKAEYMQKGFLNAGHGITFQAESNVAEKNDPILRRENDEDPMTQPQFKGNRVLNYMGGWRWRKGTQSITWEFEVPEDGLYKIGMRVMQDWGDGLSSYRKIAIDGKVPFKELLEYPFVYDRNWYVTALKDETGEPFLFYLTKGTHRLTMTVQTGPLTEIVNSLNDDIYMLSRKIRQIIMITGDNPDIHYDYNLPNHIPGLLDDFTLLAERMQQKMDILERVSRRRPSMYNNFKMIKNQLEEMVDDPFTIPKRLQDLNNALTSLSSWYLVLQDQPLMVDYFHVSPYDEKWPDGKSTLLQRIKATWFNLINSFYKDYDNVAGFYNEEVIDEEDVITVWISRGMEWGEILKEIADEDFTPKTGKHIKMNILPPSQLEAGAVNALMLAITSGKAPDVALGVGANSPVEFAIRNAVADLTQFENYEEVEKRFVPGGIIPYRYQGGVYALPETMDFRAIFYRTDIFEEIGLTVPNTWEELYQYTLPVLYQNGLEFFYPPEPSPFLFQKGGSYYNEDGTRSGLDTPEAYQAFKEFTELYTQYGVPVVANTFNRLRTGEMPLTVGNYALYVQLSVAAPELTGRWTIAPIPGTLKEDGTIDRTAGGIASQACMIMESSEKKDAAWQFLDWWTSEAVQSRYGNELEAVIGMEARWNTANLKAFQQLPWKKNDLEVIMEQLSYGRDMPVVLGGYFTNRHLVNAWIRIILGETPVRDSLEKAVKDINTELKSRQEEYGLKADD